MATVSNSEEDVYYRIDSMKLWEECQQLLSTSVGGAWERTIVDEEEKVGREIFCICGRA